MEVVHEHVRSCQLRFPDEPRGWDSGLKPSEQRLDIAEEQKAGERIALQGAPEPRHRPGGPNGSQDRGDGMRINVEH